MLPPLISASENDTFNEITPSSSLEICPCVDVHILQILLMSCPSSTFMCSPTPVHAISRLSSSRSFFTFLTKSLKQVSSHFSFHKQLLKSSYHSCDKSQFLCRVKERMEISAWAGIQVCTLQVLSFLPPFQVLRRVRMQQKLTKKQTSKNSCYIKKGTDMSF